MSLNSLQDQQQSGKWNINVGESTMKYGLIKLAPESPLRKSLDILNDDSSYDSFHNYETDICKDSSDDEYSDANSSHTEGYALMDVFEYELPDDSESDSNLSTASSGSEDFLVMAAKAASYEFNRLVSDNDDDEFILADTEEESDGSIDLELSHADYWHCVKCNNRKNNPMYRFCERCFRVRKSLFPPRPQRQKSRAEHSRKRKMAQQSQEFSSTEVDSDSDAQVTASKKIALSPRAECLPLIIPTNTGSKHGNQLNIKDKLKSGSSKHANSAGEMSCNNNTSSDDGDDGELQVESDAGRSELFRKIKVSSSSSIEISNIDVADSRKYASTKLTPSHLDFKIENKIIQNVYRQEIQCQKRGALTHTLEWKDSGLSSCQESSQEFSLLSQNEEGGLGRSSSSGSTRSFESQPEFSQTSTHVLHDSDNLSDSEGILTRVEEFTQERKMKQEMHPNFPASFSDSQSDDVNDTNLGLCRFCMVNPKNGVFVHPNCLHLCCCYKCAKKVWMKRKSCPICNCKVTKVTKLFVH